jgi:hypothetical protein
MTAETREVIEAALRLSREQQEYIIAVLSSALDDNADDGDSPEEVEAAWLEETRRRVEEVRSGAVAPVPWAVARQRLLKAR